MNRLTDLDPYGYAAPALDEILEALLLAAGEPLSLERLEALFGEGLAGSGKPPSRAALRESLAKLAGRLTAGGALELQESASGYQLRICQRYSPWVSRLWEERPQRYSRALLETLALIAYRQPVTRADIEEVRGVAVSSSIMRTLVERGWIRVVGHRDVPGRPAVYATTRGFLDDLGLKSLDSLPPMHEIKQFETALHEPLGMSQGDTAPLAPAAPLDDDEAVGDGEALDMPPAPLASSETPSGESMTDDDRLATSPTDELVVSAKADDDEHAEKASPGQSLSFAELEARLTERARRRQAEEPSPPGTTDADTPEADDDSDER